MNLTKTKYETTTQPLVEKEVTDMVNSDGILVGNCDACLVFCLDIVGGGVGIGAGGGGDGDLKIHIWVHLIIV